MDKTPEPDFAQEQLDYIDAVDAEAKVEARLPDAPIFFLEPDPGPIPSYQEDLRRMEMGKTDALMAFGNDVMGRALALARKKNADYAGEADPLKNFRRYGAFGVAVRLDDKICRLGTLLQKLGGPEVADESIEDTCLDIVNYSWILMKLRQEGC